MTTNHDVMRGQAGNRVIIKWKEHGRPVVKTSHFESVAQFMEQMEFEQTDLEWSQVEGEPKYHH